MKRVLFIVALLALAGVLGWAAGETEGATMEEAGPITFPLEEQITITLAMTEHSSEGAYEFADTGHLGFQWLQEQTNIVLDVNQIPMGSREAKYNLMLQSGDLPDMMFPQGSQWAQSDIEAAGDKGIFVDIMQYQDLMPNYLALMEKYKGAFSKFLYDGKLYGFYHVNETYFPFNQFLPYRHDLWEKYGFQPETWDDMYEAFKVLKSEFPNSFPVGPFTQGGTVTMITLATPTFRTGPSIYFNHDVNEWVYGPTEDNYKFYLEYMAKLYREGLLNPDAVTTSYEQWTQDWINDKSFFAWWWSATGNWFIENSSNNPNYGPGKHWVEAHPVPRISADGPRGWTGNKAPSNVSGPPWLINAESDYIREIIALKGQFLSDDANSIQMTLGAPGEEWDIVDGKYRFIHPDIKTPYNPDGKWSSIDYYRNVHNFFRSENNVSSISVDGIFMELHDALSDSDYDQFIRESGMYVEQGSTQQEPQPAVRFSAEAQEQASQLKTILDTYAHEMTINFIFGEEPLSNYDTYKARIEELGSGDLIALYAEASGT
jgi:putative aldouronate transport system substrate-binding protein